MRVLVTGATGFVGRHLTTELSAHGHTVCGTCRGEAAGVRWGGLDLNDRPAVASMLAEVAPEAVVHLAGLAFVPDAERDPAAAVAANVGTTATLLAALAEVPARARTVLHVSTGEVYGRLQGAAPIDEQTPPAPASVYAITKLAGERLAAHLGPRLGLPLVIVRPFNHLGPGQSDLFVAPAFARQVAEVEAGRAPCVRHGNLAARRDFTDVRDVVRAYRLLLERGEPGQTYNVCSGHAVEIRALLEQLIAAASAPIALEPDPERMRASDLPVFCGAADKLTAATGWRPEIPLDRTLADLLDEWRAAMSSPTDDG